MPRTITRELTATELTPDRGSYSYRIRSMLGPATVHIPADGWADPELEAVTQYLIDKAPKNTDVEIDSRGGGRYRLVLTYRAPRVIPVR